MELREYQKIAVASIYHHLQNRDDEPCVVIPTGGGKTPVLSTICNDVVNLWNGRILIVAHVKELLEQARGSLLQIAPELEPHIGVYSAGLKSRDTNHPIIIAGIQSIYKRADELGKFDLIIIDEAHRIPPDGEGMYQQFLTDSKIINPQIRIVGLTATPFRTSTGTICTPENILNHVCYEIGVKQLIADGFLSQLITKGSKNKIDFSGVHIRAGEFVSNELENLMDTNFLVASACKEIVEYTVNRKSVLVFATGIQHAKHIADLLSKISGLPVGTIFGETESLLRQQTIDEFKNGDLKYLVNVNVLTLGFDAPNIDCVVLLRPTLSPGLYYQMVGRGFRLHENKTDCLVLDFGGNVLRHGPVDQVSSTPTNGTGEAVMKQCPECESIIYAGFALCPDCGHEFPPPKKQKTDRQAYKGNILSGEIFVDTYDVMDTSYFVHTKKGADDDAPKTVWVKYQVGFATYKSEWICFEHTGWARKQSESWWKQRSNLPVPNTAETAVVLMNNGELCKTNTITVRSIDGEKFDKIIGYDLGEKPLIETVEPWNKNDWEPGMDEDTEIYQPSKEELEIPLPF